MGKVRHIPIHAGFTYNFPIGGRSAFLLGARYVRNMYGGDADFKDNGVGGVAGFRFGPVRLEGTFDYMPKDDPVHGSYSNIGVNLGLSAGLDTLRVAADSLKKYPLIKLRLGGHADFVGTDTYNCRLSWRRVRAVQEALRRFGIGDDRINLVEGFGEAYPIPDDQVPDSWKEINRQKRDKGKWWDRRVDITLGEKPAGMTACSEPPGR